MEGVEGGFYHLFQFAGETVVGVVRHHILFSHGAKNVNFDKIYSQRERAACCVRSLKAPNALRSKKLSSACGEGRAPNMERACSNPGCPSATADDLLLLGNRRTTEQLLTPQGVRSF